MSPTFTKGLLRGAALAVAGAAALGAGSANAAACSGTATLGTFAQGCTINGLALTITNIGDADDVINFNSTPGYFRIGSTSSGGSSFNFSLAATAPKFITGFKFRGAGANVTSTLPPLFNVNSAGNINSGVGETVFNFPDVGNPFNNANYGILNGTYTYGETTTALGGFTTDVPVPLPVVGAGLAFGFTRKLRNRLKAVA